MRERNKRILTIARNLRTRTFSSTLVPRVSLLLRSTARFKGAYFSRYGVRTKNNKTASTKSEQFYETAIFSQTNLLKNSLKKKKEDSAYSSNENRAILNRRVDFRKSGRHDG